MSMYVSIITTALLLFSSHSFALTCEQALELTESEKALIQARQMDQQGYTDLAITTLEEEHEFNELEPPGIYFLRTLYEKTYNIDKEVKLMVTFVKDGNTSFHDLLTLSKTLQRLYERDKHLR